MGHTLYDGTIVVVQSLLNTLSHLLKQAEKHPNASTLLEARLYEDMYPIPDHVRLVTQYSANLIARLSGREALTFEGSPTTFAKCYERIEKVLEAAKEADKNAVNHHGDTLAPTQVGPGKTVEMIAATYAHSLALPNIYFHVTTTYGILRKEGVPLGKLDYYSGFIPQLSGSQ